MCDDENAEAKCEVVPRLLSLPPSIRLSPSLSLYLALSPSFPPSLSLPLSIHVSLSLTRSLSLSLSFSHFCLLPHGGIRPFHQKSTCHTQLTLGPYVVQSWSRDAPESGPNETRVLYRVGCAGQGSPHVCVSGCLSRFRVPCFRVPGFGTTETGMGSFLGLALEFPGSWFLSVIRGPGVAEFRVRS